MPRLEFFFDCSSPWTYLAFHRVEDLAAETGADLVWGGLEDISQDPVLEGIARRVGLDWPDLSARIAAPETRQKLRANTDELVARGGFGSPTFFVDGDDMYFGNDRLPLVRDALLRAGR